MTAVSEAQAALQATADRRNILDAKLRDLRIQETAYGQQITRATADAFPSEPDATVTAQLEASRDDVRTQIERYEAIESSFDTDYAVAEEVLKDAQRAERQAARVATITKARAIAATYSDAVSAFVSARAAMRSIASSLPGQEAAVQQLVEDVVSYHLHQTPANAVYGQPFSKLVESYLAQAAAA